jgi:hypothetical protein
MGNKLKNAKKSKRNGELSKSQLVKKLRIERL